ncbi:hypothetical protein VNO77_39121 [Canavalia gladiata]|uniref:Uncharacterized protein n=1 Tax=Canavalia gladiata TaxID=3824 RepID=A0AAN9KCL6_CANGL
MSASRSSLLMRMNLQWVLLEVPDSQVAVLEGTNGKREKRHHHQERNESHWERRSGSFHMGSSYALGSVGGGGDSIDLD